MGFAITNPAALAEIRKAKRRTDEIAKAVNREYARMSYQEGLDILRAAKDKPCVDCGIELPPDCMDLDHVRGDKLFSPSNWRRAKLTPGQTRLESLTAEIAKCDVRCPNCHRLKHYQARLSTKQALA